MITLATTLATADQVGKRRVWSYSPAHEFGICPRRESYRNGPHRVRMVRHSTAAMLRGTVLHAAVGAAYSAAADEARLRPNTYPTSGTMVRYRDRAEQALAHAWMTNGKAGSSETAQEAVGTLIDLLSSQPIPSLDSIVEVESSHLLMTSSGLPFTIKPDLVLRTSHGLLLRDWKFGDVSDRDPATDHQLNLYVAGLSAVYPEAEAFTLEFFSMSRRQANSAQADPEAAARSVAWLERIAARAEADTERAPRPSAERCGFCAFRVICPAA